jgi:hypothetical protein
MGDTLSIEARRLFRDQLRDARAAALLDAEGFHPIVAALERLGSALCLTAKNLGNFRDPLLAVARRAKAASAAGDDRSAFTPPASLFSAVKNGRNDAVHQGAPARHLVRHCVELALLIEEGLMADSTFVADFMVRDPVCAELWQQVVIARQRMLTSSFSNLPIWLNGKWKLLSDYAVASYLSAKKTASIMTGTHEVDQYMSKLEHPLKAEIEAVRAIVRKANKSLFLGLNAAMSMR